MTEAFEAWWRSLYPDGGEGRRVERAARLAGWEAGWEYAARARLGGWGWRPLDRHWCAYEAFEAWWRQRHPAGGHGRAVEKRRCWAGWAAAMGAAWPGGR